MSLFNTVRTGPTESFGITCRDPAHHHDLAYPAGRRFVPTPVTFPAPAAAFAVAAHAERHAAVDSLSGSPGCVAEKGLTGGNRRGPGAETGDAVQPERLAAAVQQVEGPAAAELSQEVAAFAFAGLAPVPFARAAAGRPGGLSHCAAGAGNSADAASAAVHTADNGRPNTVAGRRGAEREPAHGLCSIDPSPCGSVPISGPSGAPSGGAHHAASRGSRREAARSSERGCGE